MTELDKYLDDYTRNENVHNVDLSKTPGGDPGLRHCFLVVRCGDSAVVVNVQAVRGNSTDQLSIDVQGYVEGEGYPGRMIGWNRGTGEFVNGPFQMGTFVACERERTT